MAFIVLLLTFLDLKNLARTSLGKKCRSLCFMGTWTLINRHACMHFIASVSIYVHIYIYMYTYCNISMSALHLLKPCTCNLMYTVYVCLYICVYIYICVCVCACRDTCTHVPMCVGFFGLQVHGLLAACVVSPVPRRSLAACVLHPKLCALHVAGTLKRSVGLGFQV